MLFEIDLFIHDYFYTEIYLTCMIWVKHIFLFIDFVTPNKAISFLFYTYKYNFIFKVRIDLIV